MFVKLFYLFVLQNKKGELSDHLVNSRKQSPTSLTEVGRISDPECCARRRCEETVKVAQPLHGATPANMLPAKEKQCTFCGDPSRGIISKCVVEGKITNGVKEVLNH